MNRVYLVGELGPNGPGSETVALTRRAIRLLGDPHGSHEVLDRHRVDPSGLVADAKTILGELPRGAKVAIEGRLHEGWVVADQLHILSQR